MKVTSVGLLFFEYESNQCLPFSSILTIRPSVTFGDHTSLPAWHEWRFIASSLFFLFKVVWTFCFQGGSQTCTDPPENLSVCCGCLSGVTARQRSASERMAGQSSVTKGQQKWQRVKHDPARHERRKQLNKEAARRYYYRKTIQKGLPSFSWRWGCQTGRRYRKRFQGDEDARQEDDTESASFVSLEMSLPGAANTGWYRKCCLPFPGYDVTLHDGSTVCISAEKGARVKTTCRVDVGVTSSSVVEMRFHTQFGKDAMFQTVARNGSLEMKKPRKKVGKDAMFQTVVRNGSLEMKKPRKKGKVHQTLQPQSRTIRKMDRDRERK